jgi:hypothetical protein
MLFTTANLIKWLKVRGRYFSLFYLRDKYESYFFDQRHGTDTKTDVSLSSLEIDSENKARGHRYHACPAYFFRAVLDRLNINHSDYTFVDFGSGKGRALLIASGLPFKIIIGVEFSRELNACAERNISAFQLSSSQRIVLVHVDAAVYPIPSGNLVIYCFNSFHLPVLTEVMNNILQSLVDKPRSVILIFLYLENKELVDSFTVFRLRETWHRFHIYEFNPAQAKASAVAGRSVFAIEGQR